VAVQGFGALANPLPLRLAARRRLARVERERGGPPVELGASYGRTRQEAEPLQLCPMIVQAAQRDADLLRELYR